MINWPEHLSRTPEQDRKYGSAYKVSLAQATSELEGEISRLDPDDWRVEIGNQHTKTNGMPRHNANPDDPGFLLRWSDEGTSHAVGCDSYHSLRDNVREVGKWIKETRKRDNRAVVTGGSNFAAAALPSGDPGAVVAQEPPHKILDIPRDAPDEVVKGAYRAKMKDAHPDQGGSDEAFDRVERAKEAMLNGGR